MVKSTDEKLKALLERKTSADRAAVAAEEARRNQQQADEARKSEARQRFADVVLVMRSVVSDLDNEIAGSGLRLTFEDRNPGTPAISAITIKFLEGSNPSPSRMNTKGTLEITVNALGNQRSFIRKTAPSRPCQLQPRRGGPRTL
jgi:hypothetical protein